MLGQVAAKAGRAGLAVDCVQANLCRLGCFPDGSFAYALSMFSTLGMIRGAGPRRRPWPRRSGSSSPAGGWPSTPTTSGSTSATRQGRAWLARPGLA